MSAVLWVGTLLMLMGNLLNSKRLKSGFVLWIIADVIFLVCDLYNGTYSRALLDIVQAVICAWGIIEWNKKEDQ